VPSLSSEDMALSLALRGVLPPSLQPLLQSMNQHVPHDPVHAIHCPQCKQVHSTAHTDASDTYMHTRACGNTEVGMCLVVCLGESVCFVAW
jgi:hypothetical protein